MAPASKRPLTPKKRVLPIKCTCEGLYNMIFYNYKKEKTDTHLIHVIMREGKTYKSLRDIVDILNETLEMNLTVRTLTQGTGHYVLQKDRVTANLPCQNTASGYKGTVFVNDIGVHDTLVKYLNASNSTIQNRNNATMENIKKVRINANTLVQMLVKQDSLFQMREGVDPKSIPTEHDIKIGRRSRSTANSRNNINSGSNANSGAFGHQVTPIAPKVPARGGNNDSDLSPLSCLAMLASQANQLPTENGGTVIKKKKGHSPYNSEQMIPASDNRNSEYNAQNSSKPNLYQPSPYSNNINNNDNNNSNNNMYPSNQQNYPSQNNNNYNNNYNNNNNDNNTNNYNNNGNNNYNNNSSMYQPMQPQPYNQNNNVQNMINDNNSKHPMNSHHNNMNNNNSSNMFQNSVNSNKDRRYNDYRNMENLYDNDHKNQQQQSDNMMVDDVMPNPSFRNKNRNNNVKKENEQADKKGNDERKRQRADSENDAFRKSIKTESDGEYVANPRISNNSLSKSSVVSNTGI